MSNRLLSIIFLMTVSAGFAGCAKPAAPEASCNFVQNGDLQRVSWGSSTPVVMHIDSAVPAEYYATIQEAADKWNAAIGREVIKIGGVVTTNGIPAQDGSNVIYYLKTWEANLTNEQARTTVYWSGDRIYEADVRINSQNFNFSVGDTMVAGEVDFESLIIHEFGHVLGLVHTTTPASVMLASLASATERRTLSADDQASIKCEY